MDDTKNVIYEGQTIHRQKMTKLQIIICTT